VFYAAMLAPALHPAIAALARSVARSARGRPVPAGNLHLTLAFVGNIAASYLPTLTAVGAALRAAPMTLVLDLLGGFRPAGVAWVGASQSQPELDALAADLVHALSVVGVECDARAFRPHLTIARRCELSVETTLVGPHFWLVDEIALLRSDPGSAGMRYLPIGRYPLERVLPA
jgi:2'-5' RNA ligase